MCLLYFGSGGSVRGIGGNNDSDTIRRRRTINTGASNVCLLWRTRPAGLNGNNDSHTTQGNMAILVCRVVFVFRETMRCTPQPSNSTPRTAPPAVYQPRGCANPDCHWIGRPNPNAHLALHPIDPIYPTFPTSWLRYLRYGGTHDACYNRGAPYLCSGGGHLLIPIPHPKTVFRRKFKCYPTNSLSVKRKKKYCNGEK